MKGVVRSHQSATPRGLKRPEGALAIGRPGQEYHYTLHRRTTTMKTDLSDYSEKKQTSRQVPETPPQNSWTFKMLIAVIALCVLLLVAKIFGLF